MSFPDSPVLSPVSPPVASPKMQVEKPQILASTSSISLLSLSFGSTNLDEEGVTSNNNNNNTTSNNTASGGSTTNPRHISSPSYMKAKRFDQYRSIPANNSSTGTPSRPQQQQQSSITVRSSSIGSTSPDSPQLNATSVGSSPTKLHLTKPSSPETRSVQMRIPIPEPDCSSPHLHPVTTPKDYPPVTPMTLEEGEDYYSVGQSKNVS